MDASCGEADGTGIEAAAVGAAEVIGWPAGTEGSGTGGVADRCAGSGGAEGAGTVTLGAGTCGAEGDGTDTVGVVTVGVVTVGVVTVGVVTDGSLTDGNVVAGALSPDSATASLENDAKPNPASRTPASARLPANLPVADVGRRTDEALRLLPQAAGPGFGILWSATGMSSLPFGSTSGSAEPMDFLPQFHADATTVCPTISPQPMVENPVRTPRSVAPRPLRGRFRGSCCGQ